MRNGERGHSKLQERWAAKAVPCFGVQVLFWPPAQPCPLWSADADTVTIPRIEFGWLHHAHAARWGDIRRAPPAQHNAARGPATKDRVSREIVSICRQHSLAQTSRNKSHGALKMKTARNRSAPSSLQFSRCRQAPFVCLRTTLKRNNCSFASAKSGSSETAIL